jgi:hypothetical protein
MALPNEPKHNSRRSREPNELSGTPPEPAEKYRTNPTVRRLKPAKKLPNERKKLLNYNDFIFDQVCRRDMASQVQVGRQNVTLAFRRSMAT